MRSMIRTVAAVLLAASPLSAFGQAAPAPGPGRPVPGKPAAAKPVPAAAPAPGNKQIGLTIYSSADPAGFDPQQFIAQQRQGYNPTFAWQVPGFGVVRDARTLDLKQGMNTVSFTDVAAFIDPTTVSLVDLSVPANAGEDEGVKVVEQEFQFDLVSPQKLLEKFTDQEITVSVAKGDGAEQVTGTLLSSNQGSLVLQTGGGLRVLGWSNDVQLGKLPGLPGLPGAGGLITKPTLQWRVWSPGAGAVPVRTSYQTGGVTWRADYNLVLNEDDTLADLGAWVTILNLSGASYPDAQLKLIAGDVRRVQPQQQYALRLGGAVRAMEFDAAGAAFQEKSFFEYHLYTLPRPATINQNSVQQIALFPTVRGVEVEKVLVYYGLPDASHWFFPDPRMDRELGQQSSKKVDVYVRFENREENKLGIPLPAGKFRVYKLDAPAENDVDAAAPDPGSLEFIGEDVIDHTPRNEKVLVKVGQAFDVTGERVQTDFKVDANAHWIEETIRVTVKNAKKQPQTVIVRENLYRWVNWEILEHSADFEKIDSRTIHFDLEVPPEGDKTVVYTVKYTW